MEERPKFTQYFETGVAQEPRYGSISLDLKSQTVHFNESTETIHLEAREYQFLWLLVKAQGNPVPEDGFMSLFYDDHDNKDLPLSGIVYSYASRVRKKLEQLTKGKVTVENAGHGFGYQLVQL